MGAIDFYSGTAACPRCGTRFWLDGQTTFFGPEFFHHHHRSFCAGGSPRILGERRDRTRERHGGPEAYGTRWLPPPPPPGVLFSLMACLRLRSKPDHEASGPLVIEVTRTMILGRHPSCDAQLLDRRVSQQHVRIEVSPDRFLLFDLDTMNGTFLNGRRITGATPLYDGDEITVSGLRYLFEHPECPRREALRASQESSLARPSPALHATRSGDNSSALPGPGRLRLFYRLARALGQAKAEGELVALVGTQLELDATLLRVSLLVSGEDGELRPGSVWSRDETLLAEVSRSLCEHVVTTHTALLTHTSAPTLSGGRRSAVVVPLLACDSPVGVLWLDTASVWDVRPEDLDFLRDVGQLVALAMLALRTRRAPA